MQDQVKKNVLRELLRVGRELKTLKEVVLKASLDSLDSVALHRTKV